MTIYNTGSGNRIDPGEKLQIMVLCDRALQVYIQIIQSQQTFGNTVPAVE